MLAEAKRLIFILKTAKKYKIFNLLKKNHKNNTSSDNLSISPQEITNLKLFFEKLGPIYIKLGQLLSTRYDLFPNEVISELSKLQDRVNINPASSILDPVVKPRDDDGLSSSMLNSVGDDESLYESYSNRKYNNANNNITNINNITRLKKLFKAELNKDINNIFDYISDVPIASASVADVYSAKLKNNQEVVIKILKQDLNKIIAKDLKILKFIIKIILIFNKKLSKFKLKELLLELNRVLIQEQDLLREAANCSQLKRNFANNNILYIPKVYWQYCSKNILVLEKISGININNLAELKQNNIDLKLLAKQGVEIFFKQVFEDCLFHGDIHPGNIFIDKQTHKFYLIDFGIMGSLGPDEQYYLAHNLWALLNRDYRKIAQLHIDSHWVDKNTRLDLLEADFRTVAEPILELPVSEISFGSLLVRLFEVAKAHNMQLQPQLLVFKKTLINIEAIAHRLDPELDIWSTARPFVEEFIKNQMGFNKYLNIINNNIKNIFNISDKINLSNISDMFNNIGSILEENIYKNKARNNSKY